MGKKSRRKKGRCQEGDVALGPGALVAVLWDEKANGCPAPRSDLGSMDFATWRCPLCGGTWTAPVFLVASGESVCPHCSGVGDDALDEALAAVIPVRQVETGRTFRNARAAAESLPGADWERLLDAATVGGRYAGWTWCVPISDAEEVVREFESEKLVEAVDGDGVMRRCLWDRELAESRLSGAEGMRAWDVSCTVHGPDAFEETVRSAVSCALPSVEDADRAVHGAVFVVDGSPFRSSASHDGSSWSARWRFVRAYGPCATVVCDAAVEVRRAGRHEASVRTVAFETLAASSSEAFRVVVKPDFLLRLADRGFVLRSPLGIDVSGRAHAVRLPEDARLLAQCVASRARRLPVMAVGADALASVGGERETAALALACALFSVDFSDGEAVRAVEGAFAREGTEPPEAGALTLWLPDGPDGVRREVFQPREAGDLAESVAMATVLCARCDGEPAEPEGPAQHGDAAPGAFADPRFVLPDPFADGEAVKAADARAEALEASLEEARARAERLEAELAAAQDVAERARAKAAHAESVAAAMTAERDEARGRAAGLQAQARQAAALRSRVARLEAAHGGLSEMLELPETEEEAVGLAARAFAGKLAVLPSARESAREHAGDAREAWRVLRAMGTELWDLRFGEDAVVEGRLADAFKARTGLELSLHERALSKAMERERTFAWNGRDVLFEAHVKAGVRAGEALRAYFAFDDEERLVVVGHFGGHLRTHGTRRMGL